MSGDREQDLKDMNRALRFTATVLRAELGPGGMAEPGEREGWEAAARCLETILADREYTTISLHQWRRSADGTVIVDDPTQGDLGKVDWAKVKLEFANDLTMRPASGPCPASTTGILAGDVYRCSLRAGHAGDHEAHGSALQGSRGTLRTEMRWPDITPKAVACAHCGVSATPGELGHATLCPDRKVPEVREAMVKVQDRPEGCTCPEPRCPLGHAYRCEHGVLMGAAYPLRRCRECNPTLSPPPGSPHD